MLCLTQEERTKGADMTLPSEEHYTLTEKVPDFLRYVIHAKSKDFRHKVAKEMARSCQRHYPFQMYIDEMYEARGVCEHGKDKQWCRECE